jgi:membrane protein
MMSFIADDALSRGASIAFYTVTSIAPVLVIVIAIAGLVFGHDAAQGAIAAQLSGLMGSQSAELLQTAIHSASGKSSGIIATSLGLLALLVTASGVFGPDARLITPRRNTRAVATWKADHPVFVRYSRVKPSFTVT